MIKDAKTYTQQLNVDLAFDEQLKFTSVTMGEKEIEFNISSTFNKPLKRQQIQNTNKKSPHNYDWETTSLNAGKIMTSLNTILTQSWSEKTYLTSYLVYTQAFYNNSSLQRLIE